MGNKSFFSGQTIGLWPMAYCASGRVWHLHLWGKGRSYNPGPGKEGAETTKDSKIKEEGERWAGSKQTQGQNPPSSLHPPSLLKARRDSEPAAETPKSTTEDKENAKVSHGEMWDFPLMRLSPLAPKTRRKLGVQLWPMWSRVCKSHGSYRTQEEVCSRHRFWKQESGIRETGQAECPQVPMCKMWGKVHKHGVVFKAPRFL